MSKVLITTVPFGEKNSLPIEMLSSAGIEFLINPIGRKLQPNELADMISDFDAVIAGTEEISEIVMACGTNLKLISRVGVGLDGIDLLAAERRGIKISYTPDAPAPAVAELTVGLMLTLLRHVQLANNKMHHRQWHRYFGRRISEITIGIIGAGRIGGGVLDRIASFLPRKILVNDSNPSPNLLNNQNIEMASKERLYQEADLISLHVPLTAQTKNMICYNELKKMKPDAIIINTSRGGIINENDLANVLREGHLSGAAIDVFEVEPYSGELCQIERCLLTSHMGSMSVDCRTRMEIEATEEVIRFFSGKSLQGLVPSEEYDVQREGL